MIKLVPKIAFAFTFNARKVSIMSQTEIKSIGLNLDVDLGDDIELPEIISKEEYEKLQANAKAIRESIVKLLRKVDEYRKAPKEALADPAVRQKVREAVQKIWAKINDILHRHPQPAYRQAGFVSLLTYKFASANPNNAQEAHDILDYLVKNRYLEDVNQEDPESKPASFSAWARGFRVPKHACFGRAEFEEVKREMASFVTRTTSQTINRRNERAKEIQQEADMDAAEAFEPGTNGVAFLYVPPQISIKDGKPKTYGGGFLLVNVEEEKIYPMEGVGSFEEKIQGVYADNIFVEKYTLDWDFPFSRKRLENNFGWSTEKINGYYLFWNLLKRAKDLLETSNLHNEEKSIMAKESAICEEVFFLERRDGTVFVDFEGTWETLILQENGKKTKETIKSLFVLVQRQDGKIRIVSYPKHLEAFFAGCMDKYAEGEKFSGVPQPLQAVLQAQYGVCQTKRLIAA